MSDLTEAKVGDTLCIKSRWHSYLAVIDRITPTGRIITKSGQQFNPNGHARGESGWDRAYARVATANDIAGINRTSLVEKLCHFAWDKLDADTLKAVGDLIKDKGK